MQPLSGAFEGREHIYPVRVFYEDTDAAGLVYYANYLKFAERARTEAMRLLGLDHRSFARDEGMVFVVKRAVADYLKPARLDDALQVRTRFTEVGAAFIDALQRCCRGEEELMRLEMRVVCLSAAGQPVRMPRHWRDSFRAYLVDGDRQGPAPQGA